MKAFYKNFVLFCIGALGLWICRASGAEKVLYIAPAVTAMWGMFEIAAASKKMENERG